MRKMKIENEKVQNEYPLVDLLDSSSLEFLKSLTGRDYRKTSNVKGKIMWADNSMTTFQLKLLMEEMPKGALHGR